MFTIEQLPPFKQGLLEHGLVSLKNNHKLMESFNYLSYDRTYLTSWTRIIKRTGAIKSIWCLSTITAIHAWAV
jgi:hypothetical protein